MSLRGPTEEDGGNLAVGVSHRLDLVQTHTLWIASIVRPGQQKLNVGAVRTLPLLRKEGRQREAEVAQ